MQPSTMQLSSQLSAGSPRQGFSSLRTRIDFEAAHGKLPRRFPKTLNSFNERGPLAAPQVPPLDREVEDALLYLMRFPVTKFLDVMRPSSREKPRYLLISELLGVLIRLSAGRLMLSALGLEEEQEAAGFDDEEEGTAAAAAAAADPRPWPGTYRTLRGFVRTRFEERIVSPHAAGQPNGGEGFLGRGAE